MFLLSREEQAVKAGKQPRTAPSPWADEAASRAAFLAKEMGLPPDREDQLRRAFISAMQWAATITMKATTLALAAILASCSGTPSEQLAPCERYEVALDPALAPSWASAASSATAAWSAEVPAFKVGPSSPECTISFVGHEETGAHVGEEASGWSPGAMPHAVVVYLDTRETDEELQRALALHEVGHVLGLTHDTTHGLNTIMYPYLERAPRIHDIDRERACAIWKCP